MSKYTLELRQIAESCNGKIFDFDYALYDNDLKERFEEKFINHFYFYEIGCTPIGRFKKMLQTRLNDIMPYYRQLYKTELASQDINFLLNKDLKEEYTRELTGNSTGTSNATGTSTGTSTNVQNDTPQNKIDDLDKYISYASKNNDSTSSTSSGDSQTQSNSKETYSLLSQGNIGITSSAELLEKWRSVLINIDQLIFDECEDLFMLIY